MFLKEKKKLFAFEQVIIPTPCTTDKSTINDWPGIDTNNDYKNWWQF